MSSTATSPAPHQNRYFFEKFGITERLLERCLGEALSAGGDFADLYFESVTAISLGVDEQIVKSASQGTSAGCGIRVLSGERTGYAYTDNLNQDRLLHAARTAALIASGPAKQPIQGFTEAPPPTFIPFRWVDLIWILRRALNSYFASTVPPGHSTRALSRFVPVTLKNFAASWWPALTALMPATRSRSAG